MNEVVQARRIYEAMFERDYFSRFMNMELLSVGPGTCALRMQIRREMLNGFGIAHGAITYALADSAFAFASNSRGKKAVSIETSISHLVSLKEGDHIVATATEDSLTPKIAIYRVEVRRENGELVALFKGTVYRTSKDWELNPSSAN